MTVMDDHIQELFDVLTTGAPCESHEDIAARAGWPTWLVGQVLAMIRNEDVSDTWGWTVPHVPRGPGPHHYQVVPTTGNQVFTPAEQSEIHLGAHSTLAATSTMCANEAHALRTFALHLDPAERREMMRVAKALSGAGAMADDMRERLAIRINADLEAAANGA